MNKVQLNLLVIALLIIGIPRFQLAQEPFYINYNTKDGLPSSEVYDIQIDESGVVWFTTDRGVCTYDGYNFETYTNKDGLSNNTNFEVFEDNKNRLWFTGMDGSLSYFEKGKFYPYSNNEQLKVITNGRWISNFTVIGDQLLFAALRNLENYSLLNFENGDISTNKKPTSQHFHSENAIGKNYIIGQTGSLFFFNEKLGYSETTPLNSLSKNKLLAFPNNQLLLVEKNKVTPVELPNGIITDYVYSDKFDHIWLGTNKGLFFFKNGELNQEPEIYFKDLPITSITMDREGNYWISSLGKGVFFIPSFSIKKLPLEPFVSQKERILSFGTLAHSLIFGTSQGNIFVFNKDLKITSRIKTDKPTQINKIYSNDNEVFVAGHLFDSNGDVSRYGIPIIGGMPFFKAENNLIFQSATAGYSIYKDGKVVFRSANDPSHSSIARKRITAIAEDEYKKLWVGTMQGVYHFDPDKYDHIKEAMVSFELLNTRISDIHPLPQSCFWMSSIGNGLIYANQDTVIQITEQDGLNSNLINKIILQGDSIIWLASNKGLNKVYYKMEAQLPKIISIEGFNTSDGLLMNYIHDIAMWQDKLWLAYNNGINYVKPNDLKKRITPPLVSLDSVNIIKNGEKIKPGQKLNAADNDIVFNYKGISFNKPKSKPFYRYKLSGKNIKEEWIYTYERRTQFTNLPAGEYKFSVSARNNNDVWAVPTLPFSFRIKQHYTKMLWFRALLALLTIALIYYFVDSRNRQLKQEKKLQNALFRTKDAELSVLRNQMNPHFIFNCLNSIQNYIFKHDIERANYYLARFSRLMRSSLDFSKLEHISLAEEIDFIKTYMELEMLRFPELFDFRLDIDNDLPTESYFIPPLLLQPVLENAVKYAFKHVDHKGLITLKIDEFEKENLLKVVIEDNGSGLIHDYSQRERVEGKEHRSFGLEIIKDRIQLLNEDKLNSTASFQNGNLPNGKGFRTVFILPIQLLNHD